MTASTILGRWTLPLTVLAILSFGFAPPAARADDVPTEPAFAGQFHADDHSFFVLEDPLPHLKALLTSPVVSRAMSQGPLADLFRGARERGPDPLAGWTWLNENRRWVPRQLAVGISDAGVGDLDHLARSIALTQLIEAGQAGDRKAADPKVQQELKSLRKAMLAELKSFGVPRFRLFVRFRTDEDAAALLDLIKFKVDEIDPKDLPDGVKLEQRDGTIIARLTVADFLANDAQAIDILDNLGWVDHADDALTREMLAAVRQTKAEVSVRRAGSGLLLTVGPAEGGGPAGLPAKLTTLPAGAGKVDADTLAWGRWDARRLKEAALGWVALHEQWAGSASHSLVPPDDGEPFVDSLRLAAAQLASAPNTGAARVWVDHAGNGAIRLAAVEGQAPVAPDLAAHAVAHFIPADAEAFAAQTGVGLGDYLSAQVSSVEDRMASRSFAEQVRARPDGPAAKIETGYYAHFAALRALIHKAGPDKFEPGVATVIGTRGRLDRLEVGFEDDARPSRLSLRDLPAVEWAIVGKPKVAVGEPAAKAFVEDVAAAVATGIRSAARTLQDPEKPIAPEHLSSPTIDLGLGVPTWGFDAEAFTRATGEAKVRLAAAGDLRPHFFFSDGCLVFSTSPRLSKAMLAARNNKPAEGGKSPRMELPENLGTVVAAGRVPGETMARVMESAGAWTAGLADAVDRGANLPAGADPARERLQGTFAAFAQVARMADRIDWRTTQMAGQPVHLTRAALRFAEPAK